MNQKYSENRPSSSAIPLNESSSYTNVKRILLTFEISKINSSVIVTFFRLRKYVFETEI